MGERKTRTRRTEIFTDFVRIGVDAFLDLLTLFAGLQLTVICPAKNRPNSLAASKTARYPEILAWEESAS